MNALRTLWTFTALSTKLSFVFDFVFQFNCSLTNRACVENQLLDFSITLYECSSIEAQTTFVLQ